MNALPWVYGAGVVVFAFGYGLWMGTLPTHRVRDELLELLLLGVAVSLCWPLLVVINLGRRAAGPKGV